MLPSPMQELLPFPASSGATAEVGRARVIKADLRAAAPRIVVGGPQLSDVIAGELPADCLRNPENPRVLGARLTRSVVVRRTRWFVAD